MFRDLRFKVAKKAFAAAATAGALWVAHKFGLGEGEAQLVVTDGLEFLGVLVTVFVSAWLPRNEA